MSLPPVIAKGRWPLAGLVGIAVFLALVARFWHPIYGFTVFYQLAAPNDELKITAFRELPVYVHRDTGGYDGLYYAQIAHDPTLRDPELPRAMDDYPYRARRILAPALAWLFGAGQPAWIIHTYAALNIVAWVALAVVLWCVLAVNSFRGWCAWVGVLFSAGALGSVRLALTDVLAVLLIAAAVYAAERWRGRLAVALLAASALARETAVFAIVGLCKAPWFSAKNLARLVLAAAPLAAWLVYVRWQVGAGNPGWGNFTVPGAGLVEKWREALGALSTVGDKPLAWTTLLATLAITAQGAFFLTRRLPGDRWWRIGITYTGLMLLLGTAVWEGFPGAATRVLLPLHLAFAVVVQRTRASVAWLVVGNLSVLAGLLTLRDIPREANELVAQDLGSTVAVVRFADDWYGRENDRRHVWLWAQQRGTLTLETIPPAAQAEAHAQAGADVNADALRVAFSLRSLEARTVVLQVEGRELWRGEVGPKVSAHVVTLPGGLPRKAKLEFFTLTPATPEGPGAGARALGFALYDLRVSR